MTPVYLEKKNLTGIVLIFLAIVVPSKTGLFNGLPFNNIYELIFISAFLFILFFVKPIIKKYFLYLSFIVLVLKLLTIFFFHDEGFQSCHLSFFSKNIACEKNYDTQFPSLQASKDITSFDKEIFFDRNTFK
ncbi:MAG: hypothetical protein HQK84_12785, partial [Nitrospinae bacterium]|nr:hypothetical protein [Nitrospinota bacterium]